jgi:hypothetical protein
MWRILVVLLIGLLPASAQLIGEGVFRTVPSSAVCAIALDGTPVNGNNGSSGDVVLSAMTGLMAGDVIVVFAAQSGAPSAPTVSDTGGSSGWGTPRVSSLNLNEFAAVLSGTSTTITVHVGGAGAYLEAIAFAISGANTSSIFDANGALPATGSTSVSITTSNAHDMLIAGANAGSLGFPTSTWTTVINGSFTEAQYKNVLATQSGTMVTDAGSLHMIGDAIQCAH